MDIITASLTITTARLSEVRRFCERHFRAEAIFDCGWYVVLSFGDADSKPELCLAEPRDGATEFAGGATLNLCVADVDTIYTRLTKLGLKPIIPLEDHPWGDRGFGVLDPCGVIVYCYHAIEPTGEFEPYFIK